MGQEVGYILDRDELLQIRQRKLLTSDRDYLYFALQIDYPGKLNPSIDVEAFCERWELSIGNFYKSLGDLKNRGVVEAITNQLNLRIHEPEAVVREKEFTRDSGNLLTTWRDYCDQ